MSDATRDHTDAAAEDPGGLTRVLGYFLKLGATGFGGPIAVVGYMQRDLVERRAWMDRQDFLDGVALGQTMPGPLAAQVAMWVGFLRKGALGALAVALAFVAPSFAMVVAVGALYVHFSGLPVVQSLFYGIAPAVMAIITIAAIKLLKLTDRRDWRLWTTSAIVFALTGVEEHVGRQRDDGIDQVVLQQPLTDVGGAGLGGTVEQRRAVHHHADPAAAILRRPHLVNQVEQEEHLPVRSRRETHPTNISQKVQIIVEHFHANVAHLLEGKAKAMVVTDSRKAAVKYKKAIDAFIAKRAAKDASYNYRTLVAFSGSVTMAEDEEWASDWGPQPSKDDEFTEANLNPGAGSDLAAAFKGATYKIMLVANKFQTGFDQPLLSAMYIDKKLSGVTAVQTFSRLNRTHRTAGWEQKRKTFVLDFVNKPEDIRTAFEPYFTNATLETETDPYVVVHLATKLAHAGIYTPEQVREVAELWVTRKGNNALSAAISPAKNEFARRCTAAIEADDKVTLNTLDLFRKDVSTLVRLYDFMSQIIDYGDPYMEMLSIFLRLLEKVIADSSWAAEVDLSDVVLVGVKHSKATAVDISLTGDGELKGISAAGTGTRKEPKYVALQVVIAKMNDLFGAESFSESQVREFVQGLVQRLLAYPDLINQTKVNSKKQFMESQDFQAAVTEAVVENQEAHNSMADYFFSDGPGISAVIVALADAFYEAAIDQRTDA